MADLPDSVSLSQDFKLCGFLPLIVSVVNLPQLESASAQDSLKVNSGLRSDARCAHGVAGCAEAREPCTLAKSQTGNAAAMQPCSSRGELSESEEMKGEKTSKNDDCRARLYTNYDIVFEDACYSRRRQEPSNHTMHSSSVSKTKAEPLERLIGAECWLTGEGAEVQFHTKGGFVLSPISPVRRQIGAQEDKCGEASSPGTLLQTPEGPSLSMGKRELCESTGEFGEALGDGRNSNVGIFSNIVHKNAEGERTPPTSGPNSGIEAMSGSLRRGTTRRKRRRMSYADSGCQMLNNLQVLTVRNGVRIKGHVVRVARSGAEVRAVVLLDLYLPSFLWSGRNYWKASPAFTAILNHLSCDWERRRKSRKLNVRRVEYGDCDDIWHVGDCQVLGCAMHVKTSEAERQAKFDIYAIFKSLPSLVKEEKVFSTAVVPEYGRKSSLSGIWDIPNEIMASIFSKLSPRDLQKVAATCKHTRELVLYIMPCMNLKLFPHQQAAVCWMLQRELHPQTLMHPLYKDLQTEDGFHFYLNLVSGDLSPETPPNVTDFRGGLFCDEPGLGKTVTALSLILKTQGTLATPPAGTRVNWCEHRSGDRYGYYELSSHHVASVMKRCMDLKAKYNRIDGSPLSSQESSHHLAAVTQSLPGRKRPRELSGLTSHIWPVRHCSLDSGVETRASDEVKRNLLEAYEALAVDGLIGVGGTASASENKGSGVGLNGAAGVKNSDEGDFYWQHDVWVQCDSCSKWRKMKEGDKRPDEGLAWFCNMNKDISHQSCSDPEESWECGIISSFPGFYKAGGASCLEQNIFHFANVLKDCASLRDRETNAVLTWLANPGSEKLVKMAGAGVSVPPSLHVFNFSWDDQHRYDIIFERFGLVPKKVGKGFKKWCYPPFLDGLVFDLPALREALNRPLDVVRLYLSRATLIVVPPNLVEHWKNQISRHTKPNQLRVCVWNGQKKPLKVQDLAWNFDVVITTFSRLSTEWSYKESSVLMSVHWLRIVLDEGHTLGASLSLTNKLQMAMSMHASRRWVLTGTPTPHTPNSQVAHLHPMFKFLHEGIYGKSQKSWESGILKPFEAGQEEGHGRLMQLLQRCMISARKSDLRTIPPCVRKITLLDFTQIHAESYNELVETVRRNVLMADWNDPSHVESLLNPKQWKFRSTTIRNVRLSCCVAGHIKVENAGEDIKETMDIFAEEGMDPLSMEYAIIKSALLVGGNCKRCAEWCRLPIVTPCKHLLCLDCVALDREKCTLPGCGNPYKMQSPEDLTRPENPNPKWPVPQDLIELQPSYVQDNWDPDWQATSSSKVAYLVEKLKALQGTCADDHQAFEEEGGSFEADTLQESKNHPPEKAIVFSQFLEHIHVIERQLAKAGIKVAGMYNPMHCLNKMKSLLHFQNERDCMVLLMDGSAALGLDLSFVTHVYLMEPIWDRSMEEQVVSRAHRMGATRPVLVETLAMRGTVEEQMLEFLQDPVDRNRAIQQEAHMLDGGRSSLRTVHDFAESSYLARLSFVRTKTRA